MNAPDITAEEAEVLRDKTNRLEDTTEDKLKLNRYYHCLELGVHTLDRQILEDYHFKYRRITNFCALIDAKNLRYTDDNQHDDLVAKLPVVRELITALGYENMFDRSTSIDRDAFTDKIKSMKGTCVFTDDKLHRRLFGTTPKALRELFDEKASLKKKLGYINSILQDFGMTVEIVRRTVEKNKQVRHYKLGELCNISEIVGNRTKQGWKLHDAHGVFRPPTTVRYQHLILPKEPPTVREVADPFEDDE